LWYLSGELQVRIHAQLENNVKALKLKLENAKAETLSSSGSTLAATMDQGPRKLRGETRPLPFVVKTW